LLFGREKKGERGSILYGTGEGDYGTSVFGEGGLALKKKEDLQMRLHHLAGVEGKKKAVALPKAEAE